jgi:hypothetical protein
MAEIPLDIILNHEQRDIELKQQQYPKRFKPFNTPSTPNKNKADLHKKRKLEANIETNNAKQTVIDNSKPNYTNATLFTKHITRITASKPNLPIPTTPEQIEHYAITLTKSITKAATKSFELQTTTAKETFQTAKLFREQHHARKVRALITQIKEDPEISTWRDAKCCSGASDIISETLGHDYIDTHELDTTRLNSKHALKELIKHIKLKLKKLKTLLKHNQSLKRSKLKMLLMANTNRAKCLKNSTTRQEPERAYQCKLSRLRTKKATHSSHQTASI